MQAPPFERYLLTLRLTAPARFHFLHGGVLRGVLSAALEQHELPVGVVPFAPESGRARFETGEAYRFGLTLVGEEIAVPYRATGRRSLWDLCVGDRFSRTRAAVYTARSLPSSDLSKPSFAVEVFVDLTGKVQVDRRAGPRGGKGQSGYCAVQGRNGLGTAVAPKRRPAVFVAQRVSQQDWGVSTGPAWRA